MRGKLVVFILIVLLASVAHGSTGPIPLNCNRACLENVVEQDHMNSPWPGGRTGD